MQFLKPQRRHSLWALFALSAVTGVAVYLELLGWRILAPEITLAQAWSQNFVTGALRTLAGATLFGLVPVLLGVVPRRTRCWSLSHCVLLWSIGAGVFLLAMAGLIAWAPTPDAPTD